MIKKLIVLIILSSFVVVILMGFDKKVSQTLELVSSTQTADYYWLTTEIDYYWYGYKYNSYYGLNRDENKDPIDNSAYPYKVLKKQKKSKENLLYLCSNNNP